MQLSWLRGLLVNGREALLANLGYVFASSPARRRALISGYRVFRQLVEVVWCRGQQLAL